jgi:hypothetical protein
MRVDDGEHQCGSAVFVSLVNVRASMDQLCYFLSISVERRSHQGCVAMAVSVGGAQFCARCHDFSLWATLLYKESSVCWSCPCLLENG